MTGLEPLFRPRGIAVVGASRHPGKLGAAMARSLEGFAGPLVLVNSRTADPASGVFRSVGEAADRLDVPVDLAVLCVPAGASVGAVADAASAGVRAALVCAGGFAESGPAGAAHQAALVDVARRTGVRLLGPNTSGFLAPGAGLTASFVPSAADVPPGRIAVVAASGGVNHAVAFALAQSGHGVSLAVGLGNAVDVTAAEVLEHLADDPDTSAVALHVESVADGRRLLAAVRRLADRLPVVALVVGRSDVAAFARSHTGALATSWRATTAALRQAGAVLVEDERELVDAVTALSCARLRGGRDPGVGIVTAQAGPGLLLLDALRGAGVRVPPLQVPTHEQLAGLLPPMTFQGNPVDTGRPGPGFAQVLGATAADPGIDLLALYALSEPDAVDLAAAVRDAGVPPDMPVVAAVGGSASDAVRDRAQLARLGVAVTATPAALAVAVRALVADARAATRRDAPDAAVEMPTCRPTPRPHGWDEHEAKQLLDAVGVATPPRRACATREQAHAALEALDGPVAVKLLGAGVLHKTEVGGVHLGVATHEELDAALDALRDAGARRYLVEQMAPPGVDLIVGARRDPVLGTVVLLGLGGTVAEALADVTLRTVPLPLAEALAMPDDLVGRALLDGWRGGPRLDRHRLARLLRTLGRLVDTTPHLGEIEVNPLRLTGDGLVALDAVVTPTEPRHGPEEEER